MRIFTSPLIQFFISVVFILILTLFAPEERSLGANVRIVYLHGALVIAAECAFIAAGITGLAGLITGHIGFHHWSAALGRAGIVFWLIYLPLSLWAMQANWNGLCLAEPRFRLAAVFGLTGLLIQAG